MLLKPRHLCFMAVAVAVLFLLVQSCDASIVVQDPVKPVADVCLVGVTTDFYKNCGIETCQQDAWTGTGVAELQTWHSTDCYGVTWTDNYQPTDAWDYFSVTNTLDESYWFENSGLFYTAFDLEGECEDCTWVRIEYWKDCPPPVCEEGCLPEPTSAGIWILGCVGLLIRRRK